MRAVRTIREAGAFDSLKQPRKEVVTISRTFGRARTVLVIVAVSLFVACRADPPKTGGSPVASEAPGQPTPEGAADRLRPQAPIVSAIRTLGGPNVLVHAFGAIWVEEHRADGLSRIDVATEKTDLDLGMSVHCQIAAGAGSIWGTHFESNSLSRFDPVTMKVTSRVRVPDACGVAAQERDVWVTSPELGELWRIDPRTEEVVAKIRLGDMPFAPVPARGSIWVAGEARGGMLWRVDPQTDRVVDRLRVPGGDTVTDAFGSLWAIGRATGKLYRIDPHDGAVVEAIDVSPAPSGIVAAFGQLWVTDFNEGTLIRVDPRAVRVVATVALTFVDDTGNEYTFSNPGPPLAAAGSLWVPAINHNVVLRIDPELVH